MKIGRFGVVGMFLLGALAPALPACRAGATAPEPAGDAPVVARPEPAQAEARAEAAPKPPPESPPEPPPESPPEPQHEPQREPQPEPPPLQPPPPNDALGKVEAGLAKLEAECLDRVEQPGEATVDEFALWAARLSALKLAFTEAVGEKPGEGTLAVRATIVRARLAYLERAFEPPPFRGGARELGEVLETALRLRHELRRCGHSSRSEADFRAVQYRIARIDAQLRADFPQDEEIRDCLAQIRMVRADLDRGQARVAERRGWKLKK